MFKPKAATSAAPADKAPVGNRNPVHRGGAYERIYALGSERVDIIDAELVKDTPLKDLAQKIQLDWKEFTDVKENTLIQQLKRYRDSQVIPRVVHMQNKIAAGKLQGQSQTRTRARNMFERLHVLDELEQLYRTQKTRFDKAYMREQALQVPTEMVSKLIDPLHKILVSVAHLQMETGLIRRAPRVVQASVDIFADGREKPAYVVQMETQRARRSTTGLMMQLLDEAAENEPLEGEYRVVDDADQSAATDDAAQQPAHAGAGAAAR